jgi:electron transfer flavoprotein alpha subunit
MRREEADFRNVFVFGEVRSGRLHPVTLELAGKARELADRRDCEATVLLLCERLLDAPEGLFLYGADRVLLVEHPVFRHPNQEAAARVLTALIEREKPEIVLAPATTSGRTVLPAVAARVRTGLTADCTGLEIDPESGLLLQTRPAIGGNVMATIRTPDFRPQMATVRPRTFRIPDPTPRPGRIVRPELPEETFLSRIENLGLDAEEDRGADIQDKEVVISGGKGLRRPEGFALIRELAELLDAGVGASRPTVEAKWIPYPHQVGLSGRVVAPKLYLAAGISGAVQHLAGMQTARKIVAVNKDPEAPIFRVADLALCGDLYDILPRLAALIREERGNRRAR